MTTQADRQKEKRLQPRKTYRTKIVLEDEFGEGLLYLWSRDVSASGVFLEEAPLLKVGAHLFLSFMLPNVAAPVRMVGRVMRSLSTQAEPKSGGIGIHFVDLDEESRLAIDNFVKS